MNEQEKIAQMFKALSDYTRVRIINLLKQQTLCVNALAQKLEVTPAAISQHLRILRSLDIVTAIKRGYFMHYEINQVTLARWRKTLADFLELGAS